MLSLLISTPTLYAQNPEGLSALAPENLAKERPEPPFDITGAWLHQFGESERFDPPEGFVLTPEAQVHYDAAPQAAAGIDRDFTITVEGIFTQFRWANPHCWIEMEVVNDEGVIEVWNLEMLPPSYLIQAGWTRSTLQGR